MGDKPSKAAPPANNRPRLEERVSDLEARGKNRIAHMAAVKEYGFGSNSARSVGRRARIRNSGPPKVEKEGPERRRQRQWQK